MRPNLAEYYNHSDNTHTVDGALAAWRYLSRALRPRSVLDVGCGRGTWMRAIEMEGVLDLIGLDGVPPEHSKFVGNPQKFQQIDLRRPFDLQRRFDLVICMEVAEHLPQICAPHFIRSLCVHADMVAFSAAAPNQGGQHHINCQWPHYWQEHFNQNGFACYDEIRAAMWEDSHVEPWYRQNIFVARRDASNAGTEPRVRSLVHPEMLQFMGSHDSNIDSLRSSFRDGNEMSYRGYLRAALKAFMRGWGSRIK